MSPGESPSRSRRGVGAIPRLLGPPAAALAALLLLPAARPAQAAPARQGIWISPAELRRLPASGPAWEQLKATADGDLGSADIADQNSSHDVKTLAVALVYARSGDPGYRAKAAQAIASAIGSEQGGRTLALGRNLVAYVIAADLIELAGYDPAQEAQFRSWLEAVRREPLAGVGSLNSGTLISTHEQRANNWGTMAGASRAAADVYLGDSADLARAAQVFRGWLGDRSSYAGFIYGESSWQADPAAPVGIDPPGASREGHSLDGALPEEMRRGCSLRFPPCPTGYPWGALQGAVLQAQILSRAGYPAWNWQSQALRRAVQFLYDLSQQYPDDGWWAPGGSAWVPWVVNSVYGTKFPTTSLTRPGLNMGWTDWTQARCPIGPRCKRPLAPRVQ